MIYVCRASPNHLGIVAPSVVSYVRPEPSFFRWGICLYPHKRIDFTPSRVTVPSHSWCRAYMTHCEKNAYCKHEEILPCLPNYYSSVRCWMCTQWVIKQWLVLLWRRSGQRNPSTESCGLWCHRQPQGKTCFRGIRYNPNRTN